MHKSTTTLALIVLATSFSAFADNTTEAVDANNTGKNKRDYKTNTQTADRQMEGSRSDVAITREIRQQVMKRDGFSSAAKNVKIITKGGIVTLRGPVASADESRQIQTIASSLTGVTQVVNELEVKRAE